VPTLAAGQYLLLLRIEATDDRESDSDLPALGVGERIVNSGAVASFPMPTLKFFVAGARPTDDWPATSLVLPAADPPVDPALPLVFTWREHPAALAYRLEVTDAGGALVLSAMTPAPVFSRGPRVLRGGFASNRKEA
jgi:hypothetical protein